VGPSSKLYSPVLLGHEYESSPMMPGDLRVPVGRKQTFIATHLEVIIERQCPQDGERGHSAAGSTQMTMKS